MTQIHLTAIGRTLCRISLVAVLYYLTARLGFLIALPPGNVTALWPPSGLAFAAALLWGWPSATGVFLGSLAVNIWSLTAGAAPDGLAALVLPVAAAIAAASSVQAGLGAELLRRVIPSIPPERVADTVKTIGLSALTTLLAPLLGVTALCGAGFAPWSSAPRLAWTWWMGDTTGVLVFMPAFLLAYHLWRRRPAKEFYLWSLTGLMVGAALFTFIVLENNTRQQVDSRLQLDAQFVNAAIKEAIDQEMSALLAMRAHYASTATMSQPDFTAFTTPFLEYSSAASGYAWAPRVTLAERPAFEQAFQEQGYPAFQISESDAHGQAIPAAERAEYFPATSINPFAPNQAAFGYDLASTAAQRAALQRAVESGQPAVTAPLQLVQQAGSQAGIQILLPVYRVGAPTATVEQRRAGLAGLALGVYRMDTLVQQALKKIHHDDFQIYLFDATGPQPPSLLAFASLAGEQRPGDQALTAGSAPAADALLRQGAQRAALEIGGRSWLVVVRAGSNYRAGQHHLAAWATLLLGLTFAGWFLRYIAARQRTEAALARSE
ncbi:MAG: CHASE domain-containing protein, partial [Chloroflexota bacterium]